MFSTQNTKILRWYLFGIKSYGTIDDSRLKKNFYSQQHFGAFASLRPSVPTKIVLVFLIYIILVKLFESNTPVTRNYLNLFTFKQFCKFFFWKINYHNYFWFIPLVCLLNPSNPYTSRLILFFFDCEYCFATFFLRAL